MLPLLRSQLGHSRLRDVIQKCFSHNNISNIMLLPRSLSSIINVQQGIRSYYVTKIGSYREISSTSSDNNNNIPDSDVMEYLTEILDNSDNDLHEEIIKMLKSVYGNHITISHIKQFGVDGMKALAKSIQSEQLKLKRGSINTPSTTIYFKLPHSNTEYKCQWKLGQSILDVVKNNDKDNILNEYMEGTCNGTMSCSTCHVYVNNDIYTNILETPIEAELDMLDLAYNPIDNSSRLGCQIILTNKLLQYCQNNKIIVTIPEGVNDVWHVNTWF